MNKLDVLKGLYHSAFSKNVAHIFQMPRSGSYREYYRLKDEKGNPVIGVYNSDIKENEAFLHFSQQFHSIGLPVPKIFAVDDTRRFYLQEDLGNETVFQILQKNNVANQFPEEVIPIYEQILAALPAFQTKGIEVIDLKYCYPRSAFDKQSMMWDLNYFKYYFLKLAKIPFDEQLLEDDFNTFSDFLLTAKDNFFLYRDFQSRNIMINEEGNVMFIDYQGGRKGALQYDVASLLFDSKANIPWELKHGLLAYYTSVLEKGGIMSADEFYRHFWPFAYIRLMQAMGAYGFRGFYERKTQFLQSIPYAIKQLKYLLNEYPLSGFDHLHQALVNIAESEELKKFSKEFKVEQSLKININSFSYKVGLPLDESGNGGGFIFDCRSLHNPGRYERYKSLTGMDVEVAEFLENEGEVQGFLRNVYELVEQTVDKYLDRGFTNLQVNFGCTGGQHRSVYCAESLKVHLQEKYESFVRVEVHHIEQEKER